MNEPKNEESEYYVTDLSKQPVTGICPTHTKDSWFTHVGYQLEGDGAIKCQFCPWGSKMPGYFRLVDGKIVDLRVLTN